MTSVLIDALLGDDSAARQGESDWLSSARQLARSELARDGMPGARNEAWKYTNLRALEQRTYGVAADVATIDPALVDLPGADGPRLVFVNGFYRADLSRRPTIAGLRLEPLSEVLAADSDSLREFLARHFSDPAQLFARLNTAVAVEGPVVRVAPGVQVDALVHLVFVGAAGDSEVAATLRAIVDVGAGAELRLVEHHIGVAGASHLGNLVTQIALREKARFDFLQVQNAPETSVVIRRTEAVLEADAELNLRSIEAGAQLMRHDLVVDLTGDRSSLVSRGVFALRGRQHADTRLDIRHIARDTRCDIVWRGVADQRSRGIFHGAITVAAGADGSDANLSNKNLLLSENAEIDTQPVLEIHADEVKAAHGATVGQLDEQAMFYLRSRGLPEAEARSLLTLAFCRVTVESLENIPLRDHIDLLLLERLPKGAIPS